MTTILLITVGGLLITAASVLLYSVVHAPSGQEDVEGFHFDEPEAAVRTRPALPEPRRESHSLSA